MYNIIPFVLILISLIAIIVIIVKKFPALAALDVENMPEEKEAKVKERIVSNRLKRNAVKWTSKFLKLWRFASSKFNILFKSGYDKLNELKNNYKLADSIKKGNSGNRIGELVKLAKDQIDEEFYDKAEKTLIEIIGLDSKNIEAFELLGDLYFRTKKHTESLQTFEHVLKLLEEIDDQNKEAEIHFVVASVNKEKESIDDGLESIEKALELMPNNPRYLDTKLELGIIKKDKKLCESILKKLKEVNPDNNKLPELKEVINNL